MMNAVDQTAIKNSVALYLSKLSDWATNLRYEDIQNQVSK